jgi:hypothetical protein
MKFRSSLFATLVISSLGFVPRLVASEATDNCGDNTSPQLTHSPEPGTFPLALSGVRTSKPGPGTTLLPRSYIEVGEVVPEWQSNPTTLTVKNTTYHIMTEGTKYMIRGLVYSPSSTEEDIEYGTLAFADGSTCSVAIFFTSTY